MESLKTGDECSTCGISYKYCLALLRSTNRPCCGNCRVGNTHNENWATHLPPKSRKAEEVAPLSSEAMKMVADLVKELNAAQLLAELRADLVQACGTGWEGRTNRGLIEELKSRDKDRTAEIRRMNAELSRVSLERDSARDTIRTERAQRQKVEQALVQDGRDPNVVGLPSIPDTWTQVVSVEDDTAFFTRCDRGIYKGLWRGHSGGYYSDVELLTLTDVRKTR